MRLPFFFAGMGGRRSVISPRWSAATRFRRQMATGLLSSRRPRRQAGSQGRSQVRPRIAGEHVRFAIEHVGVGKTALRDQANVFGNIGVRRTRPLAIDDFMVISWIVRVGAVQTCASSCLPTWAVRTALHCSDNVTVLARTLFDAQRAAFRRGALSYKDRMDALRTLERALIDHGGWRGGF